MGVLKEEIRCCVLLGRNSNLNSSRSHPDDITSCMLWRISGLLFSCSRSILGITWRTLLVEENFYFSGVPLECIISQDGWFLHLIVDMASRIQGLLFLALTVYQLSTSDSSEGFYSNTWVLHTEEGKNHVDYLAEKHGFINTGEIEGFPGHYLLEHKHLKRTRRTVPEYTLRLSSEPHVTFVKHLKVLRRTKRGFLDPLYPDQWYLRNSGKWLNNTRVQIGWIMVEFQACWHVVPKVLNIFRQQGNIVIWETRLVNCILRYPFLSVICGKDMP